MRTKLGTFARGFKRARESTKNESGKKYTQEQLAQKLNISLSTIQNWEQGRSIPEIKDIFVLCDFFQCDMDYLFDRIDTKTHNAQFIHDSTGLSESNIEQLASFLSYAEGITRLNIINHLLADTNFSVALTSDINSCYQKYKDWKNAEKQYHAESNVNKALNIAEIIKQQENDNAPINDRQLFDLQESYDVSRYNINRRFDNVISTLLEYIYENE